MDLEKRKEIIVENIGKGELSSETLNELASILTPDKSKEIIEELIKERFATLYLKSIGDVAFRPEDSFMLLQLSKD